MYAVAEIGGRQVWLEQGRIYEMNRINLPVGSSLTFNRILLLNSDLQLTIGSPYIKALKIGVTLLSHSRQKKLIVFKMKPKKKMRRTIGHRQNITQFVVTKIHTN